MIRDVVGNDKKKNPENYKEFSSLINSILSKYDMTFNAFARVASIVGVEMTLNRLRDVHYGRALVSKDDLKTLRAVLDAPVKEAATVNVIKIYRASVDSMCRACAGSDESPKCWDATCPLRPVSPLPLAEKNRVEEDDDSELL